MDNYYGNGAPSSSRQQQPGVNNPNQMAQQRVGDVLNITLSPSEKQVLEDCQTQASIRGVTLSSIAIGGCYYLMKNGTIKKNRLILALSGISGFIMGTMSYRTACMEKLMALPNSDLKERILQAQGRRPDLRIELQPNNGQSQSWFDSKIPDNSVSNIGEFAPMGQALDIEPYQPPDYDSLSRRPIENDSNSGFTLNPPLSNPGSSFVSYDELRRKNRVDYENRGLHNQPSQPPPVRTPQQSNDQRSPPTSDSEFDLPPRPNDYWR